jgi:hypothetical protein
MEPALSADHARALERYRHLLRTAPPAAIEQAHAQAIAQLSPEQRQLLLHQVGEMLPPYERALAGPANATPQGIARLITRAEMRQPGIAERMLAAMPAVGRAGSLGLGSVLAASLLGSAVGVLVGSALAPSVAGALGDARSALAQAGGTGASVDVGDAPDLDLDGLFDV